MTGLLDREKGELYTLTVVADDGGPKKDSTVVCSMNGLCLSFCLHTVSLLQNVWLLHCCRKLKGIPLLFTACLIGIAEGKRFIGHEK